MTINPFLAGVLFTIFVEMVILIFIPFFSSVVVEIRRGIEIGKNKNKGDDE